MQDPNSAGLFGKYFKKSNKNQEYSNKEHPLFLRLDTDPQMCTKIENGINAKVSSELDSITIDRKRFYDLLDELHRLKPLNHSMNEYQDTITRLEGKIKELTNKGEEEQSAITRVQREYEREKQLLNNQIEELKEVLEDNDRDIKMYTQMLKEQSEEIRNLKNEKFSLEGRLESRGNELNILQAKLHEINNEYQKYQKILFPSLPVESQGDKKEEVEFKKVVDLSYLFSDNLGETVCEFLEYREILNLRGVSKFIKLAIDNDSKYYLAISKQIRFKWRRTQADILKRANYHRDQANLIHSDFIRHTFIKYIRIKEIAGEYMPRVIDQSQNLIRMIEDFEGFYTPPAHETIKHEPEQKKSFFGSFFQKSEAPNQGVKGYNPAPIRTLHPESYPPTNDQTSIEREAAVINKTENNQEESGVVPPDDNQINEEAQRAVLEKINSALKALLNKSPNKNRDPDLPENSIDIADIKREIYWEKNPWCIFIPVDAFKNFTKDKEILLEKARGLVERLLQELIKKKHVISHNQEALIQFIQCFVKLFIYSRVLLQEVKELEGLKDYIVTKYEEVKEKLIRYENFVEDHGQVLETEKQLRSFFENRAAELEAEVHKNNARILKDSEGQVLLQNQLKLVNQELENTKKEKLDCEVKLKKLVKEVKNVRAKNKELEDNSSRIMSGYLDVKLAFDNLNIGF